MTILLLWCFCRRTYVVKLVLLLREQRVNWRRTRETSMLFSLQMPWKQSNEGQAERTSLSWNCSSSRQDKKSNSRPDPALKPLSKSLAAELYQPKLLLWKPFLLLSLKFCSTWLVSLVDLRRVFRQNRCGTNFVSLSMNDHYHSMDLFSRTEQKVSKSRMIHRMIQRVIVEMRRDDRDYKRVERTQMPKMRWSLEVKCIWKKKWEGKSRTTAITYAHSRVSLTFSFGS